MWGIRSDKFLGENSREGKKKERREREKFLAGKMKTWARFQAVI